MVVLWAREEEADADSFNETGTDVKAGVLRRLTK